MGFDGADKTKPIKLAGPGMSGPRQPLAPSEQAKRRQAMLQLLMNGMSDDEIHVTMDREFGMPADEVEDLKAHMKERLLAESTDRAPIKKAIAEKRIHAHIVKAVKRNNFNAVASLETTLAKIQGTEAAQETHVQFDVRLTQATLHVLAALNPEEVQELVRDELERQKLLPAE